MHDLVEKICCRKCNASFKGAMPRYWYFADCFLCLWNWCSYIYYQYNKLFSRYQEKVVKKHPLKNLYCGFRTFLPLLGSCARTIASYENPPLGHYPLDFCPSDNCPLWNHPRKITPRQLTINSFPLDNYLQENYYPWNSLWAFSPRILFLD